QLVQSRRRRIRDGILYRGAAPPFSRAMPANREIHHRWWHYVDQGLAGSRTGRAAKTIFGAHQRSTEAMEAEPDGYRIIPALVRLFAGARHDAQRNGQQARAMVHRAFRRQAARAAQLHFTYSLNDTVQESPAHEGQAAEAIRQGRVRRSVDAEGQKFR